MLKILTHILGLNAKFYSAYMVYIIITVTTSEVPDHVKLTGTYMYHHIIGEVERQVSGADIFEALALGQVAQQNLLALLSNLLALL